MPGFVLFCLLSAVFTAGNSLVCEVCKSKDITCSGNLQTCEDSENICATLVAEYNIAGRHIQRTFKECLASTPICDFVPFSLTFRPSIAMRTSFNCCSTDGCNSGISELPAVSRIPNGFECPSCFAIGASRCQNMAMLQCSGDEDHCFEIVGTLVIGTARKNLKRPLLSSLTKLCSYSSVTVQCLLNSLSHATTMAQHENLNFTKASAGCGTAGLCSKRVGAYHYMKKVVDVLTKAKCYPAPRVGSTKTEL